MSEIKEAYENKWSVEWKDFVQSLKKNSPFYPESIHKMWVDDKTYFSTIVRIYRNEFWYKVHVVEGASSKYFFESVKMFHKSIWNVEHLYKITGQFEELDPDQTPETERLKKLIT